MHRGRGAICIIEIHHHTLDPIHHPSLISSVVENVLFLGPWTMEATDIQKNARHHRPKSDLLSRPLPKSSSQAIRPYARLAAYPVAQARRLHRSPNGYCPLRPTANPDPAYHT